MNQNEKLNCGRIKCLLRYPERKMPPVEEEQLILMADHGISGDCHADGGERQISLLTVEEKKWMAEQEIQGFCFKKYKENILIEGLCLQKCRPGSRLVCGETELELTGSIKSCHSQICSLAAEGRQCILAGSARFAKVNKEGIIRKGMEIFCYEDDGEKICD